MESELDVQKILPSFFAERTSNLKTLHSTAQNSLAGDITNKMKNKADVSWKLLALATLLWEVGLR